MQTKQSTIAMAWLEGEEALLVVEEEALVEALVVEEGVKRIKRI